MALRVWPVDAVSGEPSYSGRSLRQALMSLVGAGATAARPLGGRSGVRPGTSAATVTTSATSWTVWPHAGLLDLQGAAEASMYGYALDTPAMGTINAANATNPRIDLICVRLSDPAEADGSTTPGVQIQYLPGAPAASPVAPTLPTRSMALARLNVPAAGGGSPTATWIAPYLQTGVWPVRDTTERATVTALGDATTPAIIHRADAPTGMGIEIAGARGWHTVGAGSRLRQVAVTASGNLASGPSNAVDIAPAQTIAARPFGDRPYLLQISAAIQVSIPSGLGAVLELLADGVSYAEDRYTNAGASGMTYTLRAQATRTYDDTSAHTIRARLTALAGTITVAKVGYLAIEARPYTDL